MVWITEKVSHKIFFTKRIIHFLRVHPANLERYYSAIFQNFLDASISASIWWNCAKCNVKCYITYRFILHAYSLLGIVVVLTTFVFFLYVYYLIFFFHKPINILTNLITLFDFMCYYHYFGFLFLLLFLFCHLLIFFYIFEMLYWRWKITNLVQVLQTPKNHTHILQAVLILVLFDFVTSFVYVCSLS